MQIKQKYRASLVAVVTEFDQKLSDWICHHREIGFDHFFLIVEDENSVVRGTSWAYIFTLNGVGISFCPARRNTPIGPTQTIDEFIRQTSSIITRLTDWVCFLSVNEYFRLPKNIDIIRFVNGFPVDFRWIIFNRVFFGRGENESFGGSRNVPYSCTHRLNEIEPSTRALIECTVPSSDWETSYQEEAVFPSNLHGMLGPIGPLINVLGQRVDQYFSDYPRNAEIYLATERYQDEILDRAVVHVYPSSEKSDISSWGKKTTNSSDQEVTDGSNYELRTRLEFSVEDRSLALPEGRKLRESRTISAPINENDILLSNGSMNIPVRRSEVEKDRLRTVYETDFWDLELPSQSIVRGIHIVPCDNEVEYLMGLCTLYISVTKGQWAEFAYLSDPDDLRRKGALGFYDRNGKVGRFILLKRYCNAAFIPFKFEAYGEIMASDLQPR